MSTKQLATMPEVIRELQALPVYIQAQKAHVDVEDIVRTRWAEHLEGFTLQTAVAYAVGHITTEIGSATDAPLRGIVVGQCDRYGSRVPKMYALLQADGAHKRLVASESTSIDVPSAMVDIKARAVPEYNNYEVTSRISETPLSPEETVKKILQVAVPVTSLNFSRLERYSIIAVTGKIRWVQAAARFENGVKAGALPVWLPTEDTAPQRYVPVIDISLDNENGTTRASVALTRQKYGRPVYEVADLDLICQRAAQTAKDPEQQAVLVKHGLVGRHIVVVGEIGYLKSRDNGDYLNINAFAVYEYDPRMLGDARLATAPPAPQPQEPPPVQPLPAPTQTSASVGPNTVPPGTQVWMQNEAAPLPDGWIGPPPGAKRTEDTQPTACSVSNAQIETTIREIAAAAGVEPDALTIEQIRASGRIPAGVPNANIGAVLRLLQSMAAAMRGESNTVEFGF